VRSSSQNRPPTGPASSSRIPRDGLEGLDGLGGPTRGVPEASVARLPLYLRALQALSDRGVTTVSSQELATAAGVNSAKLRKDLSHLGSYGTRGVGYEVGFLIYQISRELGLTQDWPVAIVGVGNLGRALANYGGSASRGFRMACLLDADPRQVGDRVGGLVIHDLDDLERLVREHRIAIGVIATPGVAAQSVCDRLVAAGVRSVLNFAPTVLNVPPGVEVRKVDLSTELQILAFHEQRRATGRVGSSTGPAADDGADDGLPHAAAQPRPVGAAS
jgi:redox-sensing transcriptional repressor